MAKYEISNNYNGQVHLVNGNSKLGRSLWNVNLMPSGSTLTTKDGETLCNVSGTCKGCCEGVCDHSGACYAIKLGKLHHNVCMKSWGENTVLMRNDLNAYFESIRVQLSRKRKITAFRFHSSGEIESYDYLLKMVELANAMPNIPFYFYTKRFDFIAKYILANGAFPENLACNISVWHDNIDSYTQKFFTDNGCNLFIYDDHDESFDYSKVAHCPSVSRDGHMTGVECQKCGRCFRNHGKATAVYAH